MMRSRTYYYFLLYTAILITLGVMFISPLPMLLSIPFLWLIFIDSLLPKEEAKVKRKVPIEKHVEGDEIKITYKISGVGYYHVEDEFGTLAGHVNGSLKRAKKRQLEKFGRLKLRRMNVRYEDYLGLNCNAMTYNTEDRIDVYPRIEYVRKFRIKPRRTRSLLGDYPSRRKGLGMEFADIREYVPGDSMRWVNWKATARRDRIMVNEYESERTGDTVILLDVRRIYKGAEEYEKLLLHSVRAAATLTTYLSKTKNRVGFVMLKDSVDWIYPTYGKRALYLVLDKLLSTRSEKLSKVPFEYGKFIVSRFFPPNSFIIVISPLLTMDIDDAIVELLAKNYDILIISPSIISDSEDLATRIMKMERQIRLRRLRLYARVVDWNVEYPLTKTLMVLR